MKVKIGAKIMLSFIVVILFIVFVSLYGLMGIQSVRDGYHTVATVNLPTAAQAEKAHSLLLEQVSEVRGFIIYKDEKYSTQYDEANIKLEESYNLIESKINADTMAGMLKNLREQHAEYNAGCQEIFRLVRAGKTDEALTTAENIRQYVTDMNGTTNGLVGLINDENTKIMNALEKDIGNRVLVSIVIIIVSLGVAVLAGVYLTRSIAAPVRALTGIASKVAEGDLTQSIPKIRTRDEVHALGEAFAAMIRNLRSLIGNVNDASQELVASSEEMTASSEEITQISEQIATAVTELAKGASDQAVSSESGNGMIQNILEGLSKIAEDMSNSEKMVEAARDVVKAGEESVGYQGIKVEENVKMSEEVSSAIQALSEKSREIGQILDVIRGIAEQTNLLALNAAIEAARAGDAGKGFAVVSDEIRKLAEQSGASVKQIGGIIKEVQTSVDTTVVRIAKSKAVVAEQSHALDETVKAFNDISRVVDSLIQNVKAVSEASNALSKNALRAGEAITEVAGVSQEIASSAEELAASTQEQTSTLHQISGSASGLTDLATQLQNNIMRFTL